MYEVVKVALSYTMKEHEISLVQSMTRGGHALNKSITKQETQVQVRQARLSVFQAKFLVIC